MRAPCGAILATCVPQPDTPLARRFSAIMQLRGSQPMPLTTRFVDALLYATRLHAKQTRKGSDTPYIAHLMAVSALVLEQGAAEDLAIAALLHDAIEDQ